MIVTRESLADLAQRTLARQQAALAALGDKAAAAPGSTFQWKREPTVLVKEPS